MKFIPFRWPHASYVSLGGELRQQYERFANEEWGAEPQDDNGYWLQRYMFHADIRLGRRVRLFGQLKSGIEMGRVGGPRRPDEDRFDIHQGYAELNVGTTTSNTKPSVSAWVDRSSTLAPAVSCRSAKVRMSDRASMPFA